LVHAFLTVALVFPACSRRAANDLSVAPSPTRAEIWTAIQPLATRYRLEPGFIYALVIAESNADSRAHNGDARGLMQLKPAAWRAVSVAPYEPTVWDWRANLAAGVDYLAYSRAYLHQRRGVTFSYPLLLAAFHYGLDYVEAREFDASRVPIPDSAIYRELWRGNLTPVPPP
jgi:soluble lytic murein transglycosylase-like protein